MSSINTEEVNSFRAHTGCRLRVIGNGKNITLTHCTNRAGTEIPEHKHPSEQIGYCIDGEAKLKIGDKMFHIKSGYTYVIPPDTLHSAKIMFDFEVIEAFSPIRSDLLNKEFAPEKLYYGR
ncbi:cupin domain-containing protein [[Eubacterium] cellulosolvens]